MRDSVLTSVSDSSLGVLQYHHAFWEETQCCYFGKGRLLKELNAGFNYELYKGEFLFLRIKLLQKFKLRYPSYCEYEIKQMNLF